MQRREGVDHCFGVCQSRASDLITLSATHQIFEHEDKIVAVIIVFCGQTFRRADGDRSSKLTIEMYFPPVHVIGQRDGTILRHGCGEFDNQRRRSILRLQVNPINQP